MPERPHDVASADFASFHAAAPRWLSRAYHLFRTAGVLSDQLGIGAGLVSDLWPFNWLLIRPAADHLLRLMRWETTLGKDSERHAYNQRGRELACQTLRPALTSFRGLHDCFVPIVDRGRAEVVLVAGSFRSEAVTAESIGREWQALAGKPGGAHDPALASYARAALEVPVLTRAQIRALIELLEILARAVVRDVTATRELERVAELRERVLGRLPRARQARAISMLDPSFGPPQQEGGLEAWQAAEVGLREVPNAVLAIAPAASSNAIGVVKALVLGQAFQVRCAALCERSGEALVAPLGTSAAYVLFHVPPHRDLARRRTLLLERARKFGELVARDADEAVALGIGGLADPDARLPECGRRAALALELALHQQLPLLDYADVPRHARTSAFGEGPSAQLSRLVEIFASGRFAALATRRDAFVRSVIFDSAARVETVRTHFEIALDTLLGVLRAHGTVEGRSLHEVRERYRAALARAGSTAEQGSILQDALQAFADLERRPAAELELKLAHAARLIEAEAAQPLSLASVARRVGLSRNYLSTEFKRAFGSGFSAYVKKTRIATAKRLLHSGDLGISRVGEEAGFSSTPHFNRVFKREVGLTPSAFRAQKR